MDLNYIDPQSRVLLLKVIKAIINNKIVAKETELKIENNLPKR